MDDISVLRLGEIAEGAERPVDWPGALQHGEVEKVKKFSKRPIGRRKEN